MGLRGPVAKQTAPVGEPGVKVPAAPARLGRDGKALFDQVARDLLRRDALASVDEFAIERYVAAVVEARYCRERLEEARRDDEPSIAVVEAWTRMLRGFERDASDFGKQLGLDPASRMRLPSKPVEESPASVMQRGIGESPAQRLRSVQ